VGTETDPRFAVAYFLRIPVSVLLRLCVALLAAGVSTALPCDDGAGPAPPVCGAPRLLPVVPRLRAFAVLGPGDPPVPLIVLPFESDDPAAPPAPVAPVDEPAEVAPELCARAHVQAPR
jgi:hypothetical protein